MIEDGGFAFPSLGNGERWGRARGDGMSLRDYFAAHAPEHSLQDLTNIMEADQRSGSKRSPLEIVADLRYAYADAMIRARNSGNQKT